MDMHKRFFLALLFAVLLLGLPSAQAELSLPYDADTVVSVRNLTRDQRALSEYLYPHIMNSEVKITLPENTRYDDVAVVMNALMQDYPELFHLYSRYTITYAQNEPEFALSVTPQYRMDAAQAKALRQQLYETAKAYIARYGTAEALHDALLARASYSGASEMYHTAAGALLEGYANCEGYAQALTLLYRMAGIPCGIVIGDAVDYTGASQRHAWNIVDLNGYTLIDATWNDQDGAGLNTHWYYGLSTAQMAKDHMPDGDQQVPYCGEQANWHRVRGLQVSTRQEAYAAVRSLVKQGGMLNVRFTSAALYAQVAGDLYGFLGEYNEAVSAEDGFYGGYSGMSNDTQLCLILMQVE